jgi:hypothetical protein
VSLRDLFGEEFPAGNETTISLTLTNRNDKLQTSYYSLKGGMQHENQRIVHHTDVKRAS